VKVARRTLVGPHWLITGGLISGAMWALLIAIVLAAFGNWTPAAYLVLAAVLILGVLWWLVRRAAAPRTESGQDQTPS
jgi:hypothetical protein